MNELVFITLGSNIQPETNLPRAVAMLRQNDHFALRAVSRVYESPAINAAGGVNPDQPAFLNAAVLVENDYYPPVRLKYEVLRFIEQCLGRVRTADKFAPRPLDLDMALFGVLVRGGLVTLPDPDILTRAHVALPLADLAPDFVHPVTGQTLGAVAAAFAGAPGIRVRADFSLDHALGR